MISTGETIDKNIEALQEKTVNITYANGMQTNLDLLSFNLVYGQIYMGILGLCYFPCSMGLTVATLGLEDPALI